METKDIFFFCWRPNFAENGHISKYIEWKFCTLTRNATKKTPVKIFDTKHILLYRNCIVAKNRSRGSVLQESFSTAQSLTLSCRHQILPNRYPIERKKQKTLKGTAIKQMALLRFRDKNYGRRVSQHRHDKFLKRLRRVHEKAQPRSLP